MTQEPDEDGSESDRRLEPVARSYLDLLLAGNRRGASELIMHEVECGIPIKRIYLDIFQWSQLELGRRWQTNRITVAQEHYCSAATQLIMSQLYPHIFSGERLGRRLVLACVGGELHEIGVRMVADFFELEGWDSYYLGANTPTTTILETLADREPDLIGLSVTMHYHLPLVSEIIESVRTADLSHRPKIMVGGYSFLTAPGLWEKLGADGFAADAQGAVETALTLVDPSTATATTSSTTDTTTTRTNGGEQ